MATEPNIPALKAGNPQAFKQLVEGYKDQVLNTCLGFVPNLADAEDLSQEVFVEVYASIKHFKAEAKLSTWIYRIAVNKCLEELRRRKQLKRAAYFKGLLGLGTEAEEQPGSHFDHPGFTAENQERARYLLMALESLAENQRIAFTLAQIEGHSYKEVSEIMGISFSSVESLMFRARNNLKKRLEKIKPDL